MTAFTAFGFKSANGTANRTMPDRLAEVYNVKDWGALGDNAHDDTPNIQAAMNALLAAGGGTLFFPAGRYKTIAAITFNDDNDFGLHVLGVGVASAVEGHFSGYIFDRSLGTPNNTYGPRIFEHMKIQNTHASGGGVRLGSTIGGAVRSCFLGGDGLCSFTAEDEPGESSDCITIDNCNFQSGASSGSPKAIVLGGKGGVITGCDLTAYDDVLTLYGSGVAVQGCRIESSNVAVVLGVDSAGTDRGLNGFSLTGMPMEGNLTFIDFRGTVTGFAIGPNQMTGHDATNAGMSGTAGIGSEYGLRIRADTALSGEFFSVTSGSWFDVAGIYIEDYTVRANVVFTSCQPHVGGGAGNPWRVPTAPSGFSFIECNVDPSQNAPDGTRYSYDDLPSGGLVLEGDEYDIYDAATGTIGSVTLGSGALNRRVRWDGSDWIVTSL